MVTKISTFRGELASTETWNASGNHILALSSLSCITLKYYKSEHNSLYGHLKICTHIARTLQNDGPDPRSNKGTGCKQPVDLLLNPLAYVQQVSLAMEGTFPLTKLLAGIPYRKTLKLCTS